MDLNWKAQLFPKRDGLPADLTSIDVLKTLAVVLMVVDHVGYYLFPDIDWFRVFGRLCVPLWFFLLGYSGTRPVPWRWYAAGAILLVASLLVGMSPLPLSVLFGMAIVRLTLHPVWNYMLGRPVYIWWGVLLLGFFGYISDKFIEYGTMGFLLASIGYVFRHRAEISQTLGEGFQQTFNVAVLTIFGFVECLIFGFPLLQLMVFVAGLIGIFFVLQSFEAKTLPGTANDVHAPIMRFMGRYSLEIYVIHLLILKGVFGLQKLAAAAIG